MLNEYGWGGAFDLGWAPSARFSLTADPISTSTAACSLIEPDAFALLRKYDIQACLIARKAALSTVLAALPDWQAVYTDETAVLYVHKRRQAAPED